MASSSSAAGTSSSSSSTAPSSSSSSVAASSSSAGAGGGGSGGGSPGPQPSPSNESALLGALISILQTGSSPAVLAAQQALLRRLVLEGDVIPSRLPAPRNITEMGGYFNLLGWLGETTVRAEVLASVLGVAPPTSLLSSPVGHPLSMVSVVNDRPAGSAQGSIPLNWLVRSDFFAGAKASLSALHLQGAMLPLFTPAVYLPPASPTFTPPTDWLPYIGREMQVFPPVALVDPTSDPVALAATTSGGPYQLVCSASGAGAPAGSQWFALQFNSNGIGTTEVSLPAASFVPVLPALSSKSGFYPPATLPVPATLADTAWSILTNATGLIPGVTTLGSEIALLYSPNDIGASAVVPYLSYVWNGVNFVSL